MVRVKPVTIWFNMIIEHCQLYLLLLLFTKFKKSMHSDLLVNLLLLSKNLFSILQTSAVQWRYNAAT